MRISDWSSDVCSSDLPTRLHPRPRRHVRDAIVAAAEIIGLGEAVFQDVEEANHFAHIARYAVILTLGCVAEELMRLAVHRPVPGDLPDQPFQHLPALRAAGGQKLSALLGQIERSEEHTSELQSLMRTSYAVFYLKKNTTTKQ